MNPQQEREVIMKIQGFFSVVIIAYLILLLPDNSRAQQTANVNLSGLAYNAFFYDFSKGSNDKNGFDLTRLYLTYKRNLTEVTGMRITTDIARVSNDQEKQYYRIFLKYAYLELKKPSWRVNLLVGLHDVPLLAFQENVWGYRSIAKMLTDYEHKQTSADLGLKIQGQFPRDYGEFAVSFVNGEGYNQPEAGKHKGLYGRVTLRPFPVSLHGLRLTGFASNIRHTQDSSTTVTTGFATYESEHLNLGAEFSAGNDKANNQTVQFMGYSLYSVFKVTPKWSLIGRVDWFDPDTQTETDAHFREIIGIGYKLNKDVELVLDYQGVQYDKGVAKINSNFLYAHLYFVF
ncbi:MAG: hypothetical protein V1681_01810 [Candidatus Neomarinimicrobiota bacterium]